jgi:parvulin-like peptidyl-prolyl isomerase
VRRGIRRAWLAALIGAALAWGGLASSAAATGELPPSPAAPSTQRSQGPEAEVVCRVNGAQIRLRDLDAQTRKLRARVSLHGDIDEARRRALRRESLQTLIDAELAYQEARRRGVEVSDREVEQALQARIARYPSRDAFEDQQGRSGIRREELEADLRRERMIAKLERQVGRIDREIGEEELRRFYDEHRDRFQRPRKAVVRRIFILVPPLGRKPEIWEAAEEQAAAARSRIEAGERFEVLVNQISDAPEAETRRGGLLGTVAAGELEPALDAALWSVPEGGISSPVRTFKGVHLLKVDRYLASEPSSFGQVRKQLHANLQVELSRERVEEWRAGLRAGAEIEILDPSLAPPPLDPAGSAEEAEIHP